MNHRTRRNVECDTMYTFIGVVKIIFEYTELIKDLVQEARSFRIVVEFSIVTHGINGCFFLATLCSSNTRNATKKVAW